MNPQRFEQITKQYASLRIAIVGDFCLDRYLEINPQRKEKSIETGLPVHNVVRVRSQPGAAGTILNNLVALDVGKIHVVGFSGKDGEGYELRRVLASLKGVNTASFIETSFRQTFTYTKPLVLAPNQSPRELSRLDQKNWTRTPLSLQQEIAAVVRWLADKVDAMVLMDQVDLPETGVVTRRVLEAVRIAAAKHPKLLVLADSRRTLRGFPSVVLKMNRAELSRLSRNIPLRSLSSIRTTAAKLAQSHGKPCFVTLAERGIIGALPDGTVEHLPAFLTRGKIDVVGAGDAVSANLTATLAAGATVWESLELANAAASIVVHQLGTTGSATVPQLRKLLCAK